MATAKLPETNLGVVTSWVPITTAYPSVKGCDQLYLSAFEILAAWDPGYGLSVITDSSSCLPRPATTWWDQGLLGHNTETQLSIGPITCPQAYYTALTSVKDSHSTLVGCCPIGYKPASFLGAGIPGQCYSELDANQVIKYEVRDESQKWSLATKTILSKTNVTGIPVNGWVFAEETGSASPSACATITTTVGGLAANSTSGSNNDLSSGAKAGIGVGVSLGVIGLLTLLAGVWMMMRARRREKDFGTAAMTQHAQDHDPRYPAGYGGWAVETAATPLSKGTTYGMAGMTSPSQFGGSTIRGTPVELAENRPTELGGAA